MKTILMILSTICLSSCQTQILLPKIENHERCSAFIKEVEPGLYKGKCRCHEYEVSKNYIGKVGESYDKKLTYCSNQVNFSPSVWVDEYLYFFDEIFYMKKFNKTKARPNIYNGDPDFVKESFK